MADTLLDVATEEAQKAKDEQARVGAELSEAQKDLDEAQKGLDAANDELKTLNEEAAAIRRQIAEETVSADGAKLFEDLDAKTTERRAKEAEIIALQEKLADARSRLTAGWTEAAAAAAGEKASEEAKTAAAARQTANGTAITAVTSAPLSNLPGNSDVTSAGAVKTARDAALAKLDEKTNADGHFPKELFARAEERWKAQLARLDALDKQAADAEDRLGTEATKAGLAGASAAAKAAFARSEAALNDYALTGVARRERALALLAGVKDAAKLNDEEAARLDELRDAAVTANSFALEKALHDAQDKLAKKQDDIAAARLAALAKDPTSDPDTDAAVATLLGQLTGLSNDVDTAAAAFAGDAARRRSTRSRPPCPRGRGRSSTTTRPRSSSSPT